MLSASLIQLEYASKQWKSTFSYSWHAPYARRPQPQAVDHADGDEEALGAAPGTGGAAKPGSMSIPAGLAPMAPLAPPAPRAPLWAPLGTGSADAAHPDALAAPANPAAMPMRDS